MATYTGRCHCGDVHFRVEGDLAGLEVCNCSICRRTGYLHWYVAPERFHLASPEAAVATYTFGTHTARHHFCRRCGVSSYRRARSNPDQVDVNVRCLEGVDAERLAFARFDGEHWEEAITRRGDVALPAGVERLELETDPSALEPLVRMWMRTKLDTAPWGDLPTERGYSFEDNLGYFRDAIAPRCRVTLLREGGVPIAFLAQDGREIDLLFVAPEHQGRGLGRALLELARAHSPEGLELFALQANERACRFYEAQGFRVVARGTSPAPESAPDVRYAWP